MVINIKNIKILSLIVIFGMIVNNAVSEIEIVPPPAETLQNPYGVYSDGRVLKEAQTFKANTTNENITKLRYYLDRKFGTVPYVLVSLYNGSSVVGSEFLNSFNFSSVNLSSWNYFDLINAGKWNLTANKYYTLVFECPTCSQTGKPNTHYINISLSNPYTNGGMWYYDGTSWVEKISTPWDMMLTIYTTTDNFCYVNLINNITLINYSNNSLSIAWNTSLFSEKSLLYIASNNTYNISPSSNNTYTITNLPNGTCFPINLSAFNNTCRPQESALVYGLFACTINNTWASLPPVSNGTGSFNNSELEKINTNLEKQGKAINMLWYFILFAFAIILPYLKNNPQEKPFLYVVSTLIFLILLYFGAIDYFELGSVFSSIICVILLTLAIIYAKSLSEVDIKSN